MSALKDLGSATMESATISKEAFNAYVTMATSCHQHETHVLTSMSANVIPTYATMALVLMRLDLTSAIVIQASSLVTIMTALVYSLINLTVN